LRTWVLIRHIRTPTARWLQSASNPEAAAEVPKPQKVESWPVSQGELFEKFLHRIRRPETLLAEGADIIAALDAVIITAPAPVSRKSSGMAHRAA